MKPTSNYPVNRTPESDEEEQSAPSIPVGYVPSYYPYYAYGQQMPVSGYYYPQGYDPNVMNSGQMMHYMQHYQIDQMAYQVAPQPPVTESSEHSVTSPSVPEQAQDSSSDAESVSNMTTSLSLIHI